MAVTEDDVRHVAVLARLGLDPAAVDALVRDLNGILAHMAVLAAVPAPERPPLDALPAAPLRADVPREPDTPPDIGAFAPETADGFFLVPRLGTHDEAVDRDGDADGAAARRGRHGGA